MWILGEAYVLNNSTRQCLKQDSGFALLIPHSKLPHDSVFVVVVVGGTEERGMADPLRLLLWQKRRLLKTKAIPSKYLILVEQATVVLDFPDTQNQRNTHSQDENSSQLCLRTGDSSGRELKRVLIGPVIVPRGCDSVL